MPRPERGPIRASSPRSGLDLPAIALFAVTPTIRSTRGLVVAALTITLGQVSGAQLPRESRSWIPRASRVSAWARAASALRRDDTAAARLEITHAAESSPLQPSYLWASALLAARARDSVSTIDALWRYASLGLGRDLGADQTFAWLSGSPAFATVRELHDSNRRIVARSQVRATLADSTFWPEGMDYDPRTRRFYVASVSLWHRRRARARWDYPNHHAAAPHSHRRAPRRTRRSMYSARVSSSRSRGWARAWRWSS